VVAVVVGCRRIYRGEKEERIVWIYGVCAVIGFTSPFFFFFKNRISLVLVRFLTFVRICLDFFLSLFYLSLAATAGKRYSLLLEV